MIQSPQFCQEIASVLPDFWQGTGVAVYHSPFLEPIFTDADGNYTIKGLHPGVYRLCFIDPTYQYAQACYGAPPKLGYVNYASDLTVEAGKTLNDINQIMGPLLGFYLPFISR